MRVQVKVGARAGVGARARLSLFDVLALVLPLAVPLALPLALPLNPSLGRRAGRWPEL